MAISATVPVPLSDLTSSADMASKYMRVMLAGVPGAGKTFTALTASRLWPETLPAEPAVTLSDTLMLLFDEGGLGGLPEQGVVAPAVFDASAWMAQHNSTVVDALSKSLNLAEAAVKGGVGLVIFDSISTLNSQLLVHYQKARGADLRAAYGDMLRANSEIAARLFRLQADLVLVAHAKVLSDEGSGTQKAAVGVPGVYSVVPDVAGQGLSRYTTPTRILGFVLAKTSPTGQVTREIVLKSNLYMTKNTFSRSLGASEEAHLGKLFVKIRGAQ